MVMVLAIPMSFIPVRCAKATAAGDALLFLQQVAQYVQDLDLGFDDMEQIKARIDDVRRIANLVSKGTSAYSTVKNINSIITKTERVTKKTTRFVRYVMTVDDDNLRIDRAIRTVRIGLNNMKYIYEGASEIINDITELVGGSTANEVMEATDKALDEAIQSVDEEVYEIDTYIGAYCIKLINEQRKAAGARFGQMIIY